jgi:hypothetical protein
MQDLRVPDELHVEPERIELLKRIMQIRET